MNSVSASVATAQIAASIVVLRGHRVLFDSDLAVLYGTTTKRFNEQIRRNSKRFPLDFMFQLNAEEVAGLRSQIATLKGRRGQHRKYAPYAFTEHGALMAAMVLNSPRAVEMSVYVIRAFVQLREALASNEELARQFKALEARLQAKLASHDQTLDKIIRTIRELMTPPARKSRPIGFTANFDDK